MSAAVDVALATPVDALLLQQPHHSLYRRWCTVDVHDDDRIDACTYAPLLHWVHARRARLSQRAVAAWASAHGARRRTRTSGRCRIGGRGGKAARVDAASLMSTPVTDTPRGDGAATTRQLCTRLTRKFDGDGWAAVLARAPEVLRRTFACEASLALLVPLDAVTVHSMRIGSLYVTFHVTHDEDVTEAELEQRIEAYPFREMWRLYGQRDAAPDGLDAAQLRIAELEEALKQRERELEQLRAETQEKLSSLAAQLETTQRDMQARAAAREDELLSQLAQEQAEHKKDRAERRTLAEQQKKLAEHLRREKAQFDKTAQRHTDLIAAIIQENKKEKEAKEREYKEQLDLKEYIIDNLKSQLRARAEDAATTPLHWDAAVPSSSEEVQKLMSRMEEMAVVLQQTQESEAEARAEVQQLTEALKSSEDARQADAVTYENNLLALQVQLTAFRDMRLAEEHEKRASASRTLHGGNVNKDLKENETIVRQYETTLENVTGTLQDRLAIVREEHESYLKAAQDEVDNAIAILEEHEHDGKATRAAFRTTSMTLQKIFWDSREAEVLQVVHNLDNAAAGAEKSSAAVKVAVALLNSKKKSFAEQQEWMAAHQRALDNLIVSLQTLNKRAFERQLALMNSSVLGGSISLGTDANNSSSTNGDSSNNSITNNASSNNNNSSNSVRVAASTAAPIVIP